MNSITYSDRNTKFYQLKVGDIFFLSSNHYMKINTSNGNAVNLSLGTVHTVDDNQYVDVRRSITITHLD